MKKRVVCLILCAVLLASVIPVSASAAALPSWPVPWWYAQYDSPTVDIGSLPDLRYDTVVSLGDSIAAGFGLKDGANQYFSMQESYFDSPVGSYPRLLGEALNAKQVYNMGIEGFWAADFKETLLDPGYVSDTVVLLLASEILSKNPDITDQEAQAEAYEAAQYHFLLTDVIKKADLITIEFGGNDIMQGLLNKELLNISCELLPGPVPEDPTVIYFNGYYLRVKNHLSFALISALVSFMIEDSFVITEKSLEAFTDTIAASPDTIDTEDLRELLEFFSSDNMDAILKRYAKEAADDYDIIMDIIKNGIDITREQYETIEAFYKIADDRMGSASDTAPNAEKGELSRRNILENGRLDIVENTGENKDEYPYHINAINPDAHIVVVGSYNPFGSNYYLIDQDFEEIADFMRQAVKLAFSAVFDAVSQYMPPAFVTAEAGNEWYQRHLSETDFGGWSRFFPISVFGAPWSSIRGYGSLWSDIDGIDTLLIYAQESENTSLLGSVAELLGCLPYTVMYYTLGNAAQPSLELLNDRLKRMPENYDNVYYADIINMLSSRTTDVHPNAEGHRFIAQTIINRLNGLNNTGARIGLRDYGTLQEAVDAAKSDDIIILLGDNQEQIAMSRDLSFGLDTNGYSFTGSITAESGYALIANAGTPTRFFVYSVSWQTAGHAGYIPQHRRMTLTPYNYDPWIWS